ncbi:hypothetical protein DER29_3775 [Micromonospora sp. M71_S20]|nr:hypothetical protein DER29_3775 [Micromonospora sp. M71_S20]
MVSGPRVDTDPTVPVPRQGEPAATQVTSGEATVPSRPAGEDSEATMVIPPLDGEQRRR